MSVVSRLGITGVGLTISDELISELELIEGMKEEDCEVLSNLVVVAEIAGSAIWFDSRLLLTIGVSVKIDAGVGVRKFTIETGTVSIIDEAVILTVFEEVELSILSVCENRLGSVNEVFTSVDIFVKLLVVAMDGEVKSSVVVGEDNILAVAIDNENILVDAVDKKTKSVAVLDGEKTSVDAMCKESTSVVAMDEASVPVVAMVEEDISSIKELSKTVKNERFVCSVKFSGSLEFLANETFAIELCKRTVCVGEIPLVLSVDIETESWGIEDDGNITEVMECNPIGSVLESSFDVFPCTELVWKAK